MYNAFSIPNPAPTPPPIPFLVDLHWFFWWLFIAGIVGVSVGAVLIFSGARSDRRDVTNAGWYIGGIAFLVGVVGLFFSMALPASLPTQ